MRPASCLCCTYRGEHGGQAGPGPAPQAVHQATTGHSSRVVKRGEAWPPSTPSWSPCCTWSCILAAPRHHPHPQRRTGSRPRQQHHSVEAATRPCPPAVPSPQPYGESTVSTLSNHLYYQDHSFPPPAPAGVQARQAAAAHPAGGHPGCSSAAHVPGAGGSGWGAGWEREAAAQSLSANQSAWLSCPGFTVVGLPRV